VTREFLRKTAEIVRKHTDTSGVSELGPAYVLDETALEKLVSRPSSEMLKVFNLIKAFFKLVSERKEDQPYLVTIGERVELIAQAFYERQISSQEALRRLEEELKGLKAAEQARKETDLSPEGFAIFWYLIREGISNAKSIAAEIEKALHDYPHWYWDSAQERSLRICIYKAFAGAEIPKSELSNYVEKILAILRRNI